MNRTWPDLALRKRCELKAAFMVGGAEVEVSYRLPYGKTIHSVSVPVSVPGGILLAGSSDPGDER